MVRREVVKQGYKLDVLIDDRDPRVRAQVAMYGSVLEKLANDSNAKVREIAKLNLKINDLFSDILLNEAGK